MLAAEKWYEYQTSYHKYGLDMKPEEPKRKKVKKEKKDSGVVVSTKDKLRMVLLTVFAGALCVCLILTTAYSAKVKYGTNNILKENDVLQGEIENLNVEIKSQSNIKTIEDKALNQMGMIYPDISSYVRVGGVETPKDFALALKQQAFQQEI